MEERIQQLEVLIQQQQLAANQQQQHLAQVTQQLTVAQQALAGGARSTSYRYKSAGQTADLQWRRVFLEKLVLRDAQLRCSS